MRLSGFKILDRYSSDDEWDRLRRAIYDSPRAKFEVYVHAPAGVGLSLIPKVLYTLKKKDRIIYSFDFSKRVYKWKNEEIYLTRHEEVALYAHMHCEADIYWGVALRTIRGRLGKNFMADEKELELGCKICDR
jgi:hypothetical protein